MNRNTSIRFTRLGIFILVMTGMLITLFVNVAPIQGQQTSDQITVTPLTGLVTTETGGTATFTIVLNSIPTADVTIALSSSDTTEGTVSPPSLTFTSLNSSTPQTVTVTGVDDAIDDGDISYQIVSAPAVSSDVNFTGQDASDVGVTNTDNDTAGITVNPTSGLTTTEAGVAVTFTVVLNSQPTAAVTIGLTSSDTTEGTVSPDSLTFTTGNWNSAQTVTVTGVDDLVADGTILYTINTATVTGSDLVYNLINPADVAVNNLNNDSAGITVFPTSGLNTSEGNGQASFTVVLTSQPTASVTIGLSSSNINEGTVLPTSLTFTAGNWNNPQTVTVTGVNDFIIDGPVAYTIITAQATGDDTMYSNLDPADVSVTNTDNDTAGITVSTISGPTSEGGTSATFTMVLTSQPTASVTIVLSSSNINEGTVSPGSLVFTTGNWNVAQTVTVTGVNDSVVDGNVGYTIFTAAATSADSSYNGVNPADVSVTNTDNDAAGITVSLISGPTSEGGTQATFTVVLTSQPSANVTIPLSSSDLTEGTVSPPSLVFTDTNWASTQTVTVTGVDDLIADGNITYTIITALAVSGDANYNDRNAADVSVINTDNDAAGITVTPTSGLVTTESGGTATFTVVLNSQPTVNVTIGVNSSNTNEGTVSTGSLIFTNLNWNVAQTVTVTGVNDSVADGNVGYTIVTAAAISTDGSYSGVNPSDVSVTNTDNDAAGITVTPTSGLITTEAGGTASFTVVLTSQPTVNVTIGVSSSNINEGTVSPTSLVFTNLNWNTPQTVTVTGANDSVVDGNVGYTIVTAAATSTEGPYSGMNPADVTVTNTDNDAVGITVTAAAGLTTTEAGGTASITVVLTSQPTASVTIGVVSNDLTEGSATPASLVFTTGNWNVAQTVTVSGVDDSVADGPVGYMIVTAQASSTDTLYAAINPSDVAVTNTDNDAAGFTVSLISGPTTEAGGSATFTIRLTSQPTANVVIGLSSSDATEGSVAPVSVTFTSLNWSTPQTVTVTGVNDSIVDGNVAYSIITAQASSTDTIYAAINPADVSVTNTDNDVAGITVSPTTGLITTEPTGTTTFTVVLNSQPAANVTIGLTSSDPTEGTVSPASLVFTAANWNVQQTVTITVVDDFVADGNINYQIITAQAVSTDALYSVINPADVSVTNQDNDVAGITVNPTTGLNTSEAAGGTATFTVVLTSQPTANVTIGLSSSDTTEGTVAPASLLFTTDNWSIAQTVTVTGVNDFIADGPITYTITTAAATSTDAGYNNRNAANVTVINQDNDTAGFTVNPTSGLVTTEAGGTATFTVVLNTQPTATVTIALSSSDLTEGTVTTLSPLTFTNANWNVAQTVTVTGVDDPVAERPADDGNQPYNIITGNATSTDAVYNNMVVPNVSVSNTNNDFRPVAVNDSYQTNAKPDQPLNKSAPGVLSNDTDANNDLLTASLVNGPTKGTLTLSTNGAFVYTPASAYPTLQTDSFTYRAHDGQDPSLDPPARVDIVIDPVPPTVQWDGEFSNGEIYHVREQYMMLTVDPFDNYSISQVRFLRWDAVNSIWVDIGVVTNSPYQWNLDTSSLNFFWNQVYVFVSDGAGNSSNQFIWLYRDLPYRLYMPKVSR